MTAGSIQVPTIIPLRAPISGKLKNIIDTCTPIELKSETPGSEVFFTIDGSKPDPFAALGADRSTIKYTRPFKLREGKKTVKAMAISRDGARESHVVTKTFEVEKSPHDLDAHDKDLRSDGYDFIDDLERERRKEIIKKRGILKKIVDNSVNLSHRSACSLSDDESSKYYKDVARTGCGGRRLSSAKAYDTFAFNGSENMCRKIMPTVPMPDPTLRLQRETDFLKCAHCFATRPHDPHARHCMECGKTLPQIPLAKTMPQPKSGNLGTCFYCKSQVPFNTKICVVCENPIDPQLQPQASFKLQSKVICSSCTTPNPMSYASCVACDAKLPHDSRSYPVDVSRMLASQGGAGSNKTSTCNQCFRVNRSDARFCDWCGAKPQKVVGPLTCARCGGSNNPFAKFCLACGTIIQSPPSINMNTAGGQAAWLQSIDAKAMHILNKQYNTVSTQTFGMFYPSAKGLENKYEKEWSHQQGRATSALTAISAGRGYWRQQMDHVCAHLKAYAQNNSEFRALIGEPRLGKLHSAKVDIDSSWCTITAAFPIRTGSANDRHSGDILENPFTRKSHLNNADYEMMAAAVAAHHSQDSYSSEDSAEYSDDYHKRNHHRRKRPVNRYEEKLNGEDRQLIKELSKEGKGRAKEVAHILNEGANPNAITKDGLSMLHLAIRNRHYECIKVLLDRDADIKAKAPPKGNTVLHEAALLGPDAEMVIKLLLDYGANPAWKNSRNETAFDLAIKENNQAVINVLGAKVGNDMLNTYLKSKSGDVRP